MLQIKTIVLRGVVLGLLSTSCTIKGSGSQRARVDSGGGAASGDAAPAEGESEGEGEVVDGETCLKLAEKKKRSLKLQDEEGGEGETEVDPGADTSGCSSEEAPVEEEPVEEEPVDEG